MEQGLLGDIEGLQVSRRGHKRKCPLKADWSHPAPPAERLGSLIPVSPPYNDEGIQAEAPSAMYAEDLTSYPNKFERKSREVSGSIRYQ